MSADTASDLAIEMVAQCGYCLEDHPYRLISDCPEDWEQLMECGA